LSWQDKELYVRRQEELKKSLFEKDKLIQRQQIKKYWDKLLNANDKLNKKIRLYVNAENAIIQKNPIRNNDEYYLNYSDYECKIMADGFIIYYDCASARFFAERLMLNKHNNTVYDINDSSIDTLIRNLCTGRPIYEGLEPHNLKDRLCLIATTVYESTDAKEVLVLRNFRDYVLLNYGFGIFLVRLYYIVSPSIANYISDKRVIKYILRKYILEYVVSYLLKFNTRFKHRN
jgi:hypothetical protein